jgi:hypothetical protein
MNMLRQGAAEATWTETVAAIKNSCPTIPFNKSASGSKRLQFKTLLPVLWLDQNGDFPVDSRVGLCFAYTYPPRPLQCAEHCAIARRLPFYCPAPCMARVMIQWYHDKFKREYPAFFLKRVLKLLEASEPNHELA